MMKKVSISFATVTAVFVCFAALSLNVSAQYLVSSKAGFVNRAEGTVSILRVDSEDGQAGRASLGTQMRDGDRLMTGADARAEILLSPGNYLRLNQNSEVRAVNTNWASMTFELVKGAMIVEVGIDPQPAHGFVPTGDRTVTKKTPLEVVTPQGTFFVAKDSLVRVDAKSAATWVAVRQGEIKLGTRDLVASNKAEKVKRGKLVRLTSSAQPELAKVDKDQVDDFDTWSFTRAQTLVAANLAALRQNSFLSQMGWYYNSFYGCYTFVPRRGYLVSPYGFGFFRNWADCYWYNPFYGGYYGGGYYGGGYYGNGGGSVAAAPNLPGRVISGLDREPIRREIPAERGVITDNGFGRADMGSRGMDIGSRGVSTSSSSNTVSTPSVISTPAPTRSDSGGATNMPTRGGNNN
jgi:hypothetical protein